jgi:magnesium transporter
MESIVGKLLAKRGDIMTLDQINIEDVLDQLREALSREDWDRAVDLVEAMRPADQADVFYELPPDKQDQLLPRLDPEDSADILEELEDEDAAEIATRLEVDDLASILNRMEPDEAADLLGDIDPEQVEEALSVLDDSEEIKTLLEHQDETAGGLMTSARVVLHQDINAGEAIQYLRNLSLDTDDIHYVYVVDDDNRLVGIISLYTLLVSQPDELINQILDPDVIAISADADQEQAARLMARYDLLALPVVDNSGQLLGIITHDDLVDVLEEEATEDIYRLGGIPEEQDVNVSLSSALQTRLPWLVLNLGTAMASVAVLSLFENTIARVAILAAFFPIVAGVSGSAGTQTLTVIVRGLALGEIYPRQGIRALGREVLIGLTNGVVIGVLVAGIALIWKGTPMLGVVVGLATLLNMIGAGLAGGSVPLIMQLLKIDPALASPILVSTITDTLGYLIYLGLATLVFIRFV